MDWCACAGTPTSDISPGRLHGVLDRPKTRVESGTTVGPMEPLDVIRVCAAATDPAVCRISADPAAVASGLCTPVVKSRTLALAEGDSLAYPAVPAPRSTESGFRVGAIGHGADGPGLAERTAGAQVIRREHCTMTAAY